MNWEALGAIGEIVGASAVLFTLVYLAIQIRQNTRQIGENTRAFRLSSRDSTQQAFSRWRHVVASAPDLADLYLRGCADFGALPAADRFRFGVLLQELLFSYDMMYQQVTEELYESDLWERQLPALLGVLKQPGVRDWWSRNKRIFLPGFVAAINDSLAAAAPGESAV